jgi:hypothetical protein
VEVKIHFDGTKSVKEEFLARGTFVVGNGLRTRFFGEFLVREEAFSGRISFTL